MGSSLQQAKACSSSSRKSSDSCLFICADGMSGVAIHFKDENLKSAIFHKVTFRVWRSELDN